MGGTQRCQQDASRTGSVGDWDLNLFLLAGPGRVPIHALGQLFSRSAPSLLTTLCLDVSDLGKNIMAASSQKDQNRE